MLELITLLLITIKVRRNSFVNHVIKFNFVLLKGLSKKNQEEYSCFIDNCFYTNNGCFRVTLILRGDITEAIFSILHNIAQRLSISSKPSFMLEFLTSQWFTLKL